MTEPVIDPKVAAIISRVTRLGQLIKNQASVIKKASNDAYALDFLREKRDLLNANFDKAELLHTELLTMTNEETQKIYSYFEEKFWDGVSSTYTELTEILDERVNLLYKSRDERTMTSSSPLTGSHVVNPLHNCSTSVNYQNWKFRSLTARTTTGRISTTCSPPLCITTPRSLQL